MKKKLLITLSVVACALLLVVGSIAGTIAYLTSTQTVTNTFTVGNVSITLVETDTDEYGEFDATSATQSTKGNDYKLIPGHTYTKDPTITVASESEDCWLFVKVENGLAEVEVAEADGDTIVEQMTANDWKVVSGNVYAYKDIQSAGDTLTPFSTFTLAGDADVAKYADADAKIVVTAYAVQADGFDTAAAAWAAAFGA